MLELSPIVAFLVYLAVAAFVARVLMSDDEDGDGKENKGDGNSRN